MKLKTLNDFMEKDNYGYSGIDGNELKAEAVKWVKKFESERGTCKTYNHEETNGAIDVLIKFFNLTDEDLRSEK